MLRPSLRDLRARKSNGSRFEPDGFWRSNIWFGHRFGALKKRASVWIGRGDGLMGANSNLFNVCTVVYVIVTRGPVLESIERDSMDEIPGTVSVCDVKERLETVGLSN